MATINNINRETIPGTKYSLQKIAFQKPDLKGQMHEQYNEVYYKPDAVAVLLVSPKALTFPLARQLRHAALLNGSDKGYPVETSAGLIDKGESPEAAAQCEVLEETGYTITELEKTGSVYSSAAGIAGYVLLFTASYDPRENPAKGSRKPGEGEAIESIELSFGEARQQLRSGVIRDAKTLLLLQQHFPVTPHEKTQL
jgi:GDP-mannose pyrophosphatase NudK